MPEKPRKTPGVRICIALTSDGVTAYGNPAALRSLAEWVGWLAESDPKEHFECHVTMSLENDASLFEGARPRNVWSLVAGNLRDAFPVRTDEHPGFELTFMVATDSDLDQMAMHQESGILPDA
jgi:hypothetical protein